LQVNLQRTSNGLLSTQEVHSIDISQGGDPFHTHGAATEELFFAFTTSPSRYQQHMMHRRLWQAADHALAAPSPFTISGATAILNHSQLWVCPGFATRIPS